MRILHIEPTPSPNAMKINLDERLPDGQRYTWTMANKAKAPEAIRNILDIPGVTEVFHTADFLSVERKPGADWEAILAAVRQAFGEDASASAKHPDDDDHYGEARVYVQKFRGIPLQVRVKTDREEVRVNAPERFIDAAMKAQYGSPNLIRERTLYDYGVRYGELAEIAEQVLQELDASHDDERLAELTERALRSGDGAPAPKEPLTSAEIAKRLEHSDWKVRYAAFEQLKPEIGNLPLVVKAASDSHFSLRRLAAVYLGDIREPAVFPHLYRLLKDPSPAVRRTAGDCLSDIGDPDAIGPMCEALADPSKIVRWRAARFLYEVGNETALEALRKAADDPEFEVRMQVRYAIARIEGGEEAAGTVWQQMTRRPR
jgi:hypothetical protein